MTNTGQDLENVIGHIERACLPLGFNISNRKKIYDESGNQIAELDIEVSGKIGTTDIKWRIECRDRPSDGSAPVSWIEQLVGRRERLNFNKVTAVSSTGFSPSAINFAAKKGIEIRSVLEIQQEDISDWFKLDRLIFDERIGDLKNVQIFIHNAKDEQVKEIEDLLNNIDKNTKVFSHTSSNEKFSANNIWREAMNLSQALFENVKPESPPIRKTLDVNYKNPESRYKFISQGDALHIERMKFTADMSINRTLVPRSKITKYFNEQDQDLIAETIHFAVNNNKHHKDIAIHKINDRGEIKIVVSAIDLKEKE